MLTNALQNLPAERFEHAHIGLVERPPLAFANATSRAVYASRRVDPVALVAAMVFATAAFTSLQYLDVLPTHKQEQRLAVVNVIDLAAPPPPKAPPEQKLDPNPHVQSPIVVPPPLVATNTPPPTVALADTPAPPEPVPVAPTVPVKSVEAAAVPASTAPADGGDLSSKMISATPPTYPEESRRLHEQGTVVLAVLLALDGRVERVSVSRSSGFYRLDRAASGAVRHWRWSPTLRNGQEVFVQGNVVIPFTLRG